MDTRDLILEESEAARNLLLLKNDAYGDSALNTANIFSQGNAVDSLCARIDDKLMRIKMRGCLLYTSPSPRDRTRSRMPSSA